MMKMVLGKVAALGGWNGCWRGGGNGRDVVTGGFGGDEL